MAGKSTDIPNLYVRNGIYFFKKGKVEKSLKTTDKKTALNRMKIEEASLNEYGDSAFKFTFGELHPEYIRECELALDGKSKSIRRIRQNTFKEIEGTLRLHLLPFFTKDSLNKLNTDRWERYCDSQELTYLKPHRKVLKGFLKWCKKKNFIKALPDLEYLPEYKPAKRRPLKQHEILALFAEADSLKMLLFIGLTLFMGMRLQETSHLAWDSINLRFKFLTLTDTEVKTDEGREIPINSYVYDLLLKWRDQLIEEYGSLPKYVFPHSSKPKTNHCHKTSFYKPLRRILKKASLPDVTPHDFRATYEVFSNKSTEHTDTQREKMVGASINVQKKLYALMGADDLRGIEEVVKVEGLREVISAKINSGQIKGNQEGETLDQPSKHLGKSRG